MENIDWATEWWRSPVWIFGVWILVMVGFLLLGWLLVKRTGWGRQFWRLSSMFFLPHGRSFRAFKPILTVALLLLFTVIQVRLSVLFSFQNNELFTALQESDQPAFWRSVVVYAVLATVAVLLALITFYVGQAQIIAWRLWLNQRMLGDWMTGAAYHRSRFVAAPIDNPDQRIQADITAYASTSQSLALGMVGSMVTLVSFTAILWGLSGPLPIGGVTIPRGMVFLAYIYVIIATVIAFRIGRPLIRLNFLNERLTASYRYALVRVRENSENVAFFRGEQVESGDLLTRFSAVIANYWQIVYRSLKFQGFNLVVTQIAGIFAALIQAPRFFAGQITLGDVTQTGTAFGNVQGALSFFRLAYDDFAGYRAVLNRLTGMLDSNDESRSLPGPVVEPKASGLGIRDLSVGLPDGRPLLSNLNLELAGGASLLVKGPSGTGKTTLLRGMAGLWPHVSGTIGTSAEGGTMFCSQQPYLPLGTLRTALAYPQPAETLDDATAHGVLGVVFLGHLAGRIDEEADWSKMLSPGEQQRLSFGRVLLARPATVFLDESTSALDEGMEYAMYAVIRQYLPGCTIVSVGHRSTLDALHTDELRLLGDGRWEAKTLVGG